MADSKTQRALEICKKINGLNIFSIKANTTIKATKAKIAITYLRNI